MTDQLPPRRFDERWRMSRAGIVNVWHYLDNTFDLSGGRMILRGTNGSGKSRALEMLLPFLLDGDRRRMDATGSGRVSLDELMRTGAAGQTNRTGYLWLELERPDGQFLTIGALIRHSQSAGKTQVWYFTTPLRVGHELILISTNREPLTRDALTELIGPEQLTESAEAHRERVRGSVFGLLGEAGRDRYQGLLQLLHTLRSPDVGNRIDEGRLPQILGDSMPPLGEQILARAGEQLDGLTETRTAQQRLEGALAHVRKFLDVYRRYAASTLLDAARRTLCSTDELQSAEGEARRVSAEHERLQQDFAERRVAEERLRADLQELENAIKGIQAREVFKTADDLVQRDRTVAALAHSADQAMVSAERERGNHARAVDDADRRLGELREAVESAAGALGESRRALHEAALPGGALPGEVHSVDQPITGVPAVLRTTRDGRPKSIPRPQAKRVIVLPADLDGCRLSAESAAGGARERLELAERRLAETRRLAYEEQKVLALESDAAHALDTATRDADEAADATVTRDDVAVTLAAAWRGWTTDPVTADLLGDLDWTQDATIGPLLLDVEALAGDESGDLSVLDRVADTAARAARGLIAGARAELGARRGRGRQRPDESRARAVRAAAHARSAAPRRTLAGSGPAR